MVRYFEIDFVRGIAVLMMIIFHFLSFLNYFNFTNFSLYSGFIGRFQIIIPLLFLTISGISSSIELRIKGERMVLLKGLKILFFALLISLITYLFFKDYFIFFGILHLISFCSLISIFFENKNFALITGLIILLISPIINSLIVNYKYLSIFGFNYPFLNTFDYYPIFPWLGIYLIGIYLGLRFFINKKSNKIENKLINFFCFLGKNALFIYFLHIILLFYGFFIYVNFF